ncbi:alkaline phosphatase family protein [Marinifilum sp.]|uniref:alkaline phosphatase family protein n=1 Tax=Marinifilum sp. TaxID=2033137 RepID=UPI003BAC1682
MKNLLQIVIFTTLLISLASCNREFKPKSIKHVVVIGIDGMSVGGLIKANTPNFDKYIKNGAHNFHTRDVMPTVSSPNWTAMLTGSYVAQTGVTSNDWRYNNYNLPPVVTTENGRYPDIFYAIKKSNPQLTTASVYHWSGFGNLYDHKNVDFDFDTDGEVATADKVAELIKSEKPNFTFVQIDHVDGAGHHFGHMTEGYFKSVELADSLSGIIVEATKEAGIFDQSLFIILADHGGHGYDHGHETVQGNEVPFILYGSSIKKDYQIPTAVNVMDVAATSAFALDVKRPQVWVSRPVVNAFLNSPKPDPETLMGQFMASSAYVPVIKPRDKDGSSGGLYIGKKAMVSIESAGTSGEIRYTLDGTIPSKQSKLYTEAFELDYTAVVKATYFGNDGSQSAFSSGYFRVVEQVKENTGVNYQLYKGENWSKLPNFNALKPIEIGKTFEMATDAFKEKIGSYTALVFDGYLNIENEGEYIFATRSDDGSKLYINEIEVVNNDGDHGVQEKEGSINLSKGKHKIRVEYFNGGGGFFLSSSYSGPGIPKQIISPDRLSIN